MQLTRTLSQHKMKDVVRKSLYFGIVLLISQVELFGIKGIIGISFLSLSYLLGYEYVGLYFVGLITTFNLPIIIVGIGIYVVVECLNLFKLIKAHYIPILVSFFIAIYMYLFYFSFSIHGLIQCLMIFLLEYMLQIQSIELVSFFYHSHIQKMSKKEQSIMLSFLIIIFLNFKHMHHNMIFIGVSCIILYATYTISLQSSSYLAVFSLITLSLGHFLTIYDVLALFIPIVIYNVYMPRNKLSFILLYILSKIWIIIFDIEDIKTLLIRTGFIAIIFLLIPTIKQDNIENRLSTSSILESERRKMSRKLEEFSDLFYQITHSFETTITPVNTKLYVGHFYDKVCKDCTSCHQCFDRYNGNHRLIKLFMKGLEEKLPLNDIRYVQSHCLKSKEYKEHLKLEKERYLQQEKMNREYDILKKNLYHQLHLIENVFNHFCMHIGNGYNDKDEYVLELLRGYHFDIQYLNRVKITNHHDELDITIRNITAKEIYEELLPLLNKGYQTTFRLAKQKIPKQRGYIHLLLENKPVSYMSYGIVQIGKDEKYCGDQYAIFEQGDKNIFAISDGMGHGLLAYQESSFLLDIFQKLLKTGTTVESSIKTTNALLRIKNKADMFTTLDLGVFNSHTMEMEFYKNGSMHSFVIRDKAIIEIEGRSLPIGIMNDVEAKYEKIELVYGDFVVMLSDGVGEIEEEKIIHYILEHQHLTPQMIASSFNDMLKLSSAIDDVTLLILKVEK